MNYCTRFSIVQKLTPLTPSGYLKLSPSVNEVLYMSQNSITIYRYDSTWSTKTSSSNSEQISAHNSLGLDLESVEIWNPGLLIFTSMSSRPQPVHHCLCHQSSMCDLSPLKCIMDGIDRAWKLECSRTSRQVFFSCSDRSVDSMTSCSPWKGGSRLSKSCGNGKCSW